jgi:hypothetical protein
MLAGNGPWVTGRELHEAELFLKSRQLLSHTRNSKNLTDPESKVLFSQEPATGLCPAPDKSNLVVE